MSLQAPPAVLWAIRLSGVAMRTRYGLAPLAPARAGAARSAVVAAWPPSSKVSGNEKVTSGSYRWDPPSLMASRTVLLDTASAAGRAVTTYPRPSVRQAPHWPPESDVTARRPS